MERMKITDNSKYSNKSLDEEAAAAVKFLGSCKRAAFNKFLGSCVSKELQKSYFFYFRELEKFTFSENPGSAHTKKRTGISTCSSSIIL